MIKIGDIIISNLFIGSTQVSKAYLGDVKVWPITTETNYVTFTAQQDNSSIGLTKLSTNQTLEYSTDTVTWNIFDTSANIPLNTGNKVYVRGKLSADNTGSNYTQFKMTGKIAASGNTNSIWDYENPDAQLKQYCGYRLFSGCTSLTTAPELHATTLADYCYRYMFYNCTGLTKAPELPATTLAKGSYWYMFYNCTSLTAAPELHATILAGYCYEYMFQNCTSLNYIKCLAVNGIDTNYSTYNWVSGVPSNGTFVKTSSASWPTGNNGIPSGWTTQDA